MGFFANLFQKKKYTESVVLIDISANSVAGAYVRYIESEIPCLLFECRLPIEVREGEPQDLAMVRSLQTLGDELIREGAPILLRATGDGHSDKVLVSIDSPWEEISVRTEKFERKDPFMFTKNMVTTALEKTNPASSEKILADESIIGTILNGYGTNDPYGKRVHRASVIVISTFINKDISKSIVSTLRSIFHTKHVVSIAGRSLRYQAIRAAFPHEHDALILDAAGSLTSVALIRKNLFTAFIEVPTPITNAESWIETITSEFTELAKQYPLPRVIFLLANESDISSLQQALTTTPQIGGFNSLWLSDNPPKIVPVLAGTIAGLIRQTATSTPDLQLHLMALYYQQMLYLNHAYI
ncbi:MAG: hypothetical protein NTU85_03055 [Candidatus Kaiserbacteria bacterium]|nr:hypothetical protein [Candidatus Kaiserbacteria bacterium]